jgi:hypothetical protein
MSNYIVLFKHGYGLCNSEDVSVHATLIEARAAIRDFALDIVDDHDAPPSDADFTMVMDALAMCGEYPRVYRCDDDSAVAVEISPAEEVKPEIATA